MIGNFEIKKSNLGLSDSVVNMSDYSAITDLLLCKKDVSFTEEEFATMSEWGERIGNGTVFHIKNIVDSVSQIEDSVINISKSNYRYVSRPGKYRFVLSLNVDAEYYRELRKLSGQSLNCFLSDINNNLIGIKSGVNIVPLSADFVYIPKLEFGNTQQASMTTIIVDLYDANQLDNAYIIKPEWLISDIVPVFYNISFSQTFTRNNCSVGWHGSKVTYTVDAGIYSSYISQSDANNKALSDIAINGQAYANTHGTCTIDYSPIFTENFDNWSAGMPVGWYKTNPSALTVTNNSNRTEIGITVSPGFTTTGVRRFNITDFGQYSKLRVTVNVDLITDANAFAFVIKDTDTSTTNSTLLVSGVNQFILTKGANYETGWESIEIDNYPIYGTFPKTIIIDSITIEAYND